MLWGFSLQFWQTIVFWLWAIAAGTGGVAVAASFGSSVISYYISDATETAAKIKISEANSIAAKANSTAQSAIQHSSEVNLQL